MSLRFKSHGKKSAAHQCWNFDDLLGKIWDCLKLVKLPNKPKTSCQVTHPQGVDAFLQGHGGGFLHEDSQKFIKEFKYLNTLWGGLSLWNIIFKKWVQAICQRERMSFRPWASDTAPFPICWANSKSFPHDQMPGSKTLLALAATESGYRGERWKHLHWNFTCLFLKINYSIIF